jgi:hypothetical protein
MEAVSHQDGLLAGQFLTQACLLLKRQEIDHQGKRTTPVQRLLDLSLVVIGAVVHACGWL